MHSQETFRRTHATINTVERVTKTDVTSKEGRASAIAILTSEHQHIKHPLIASIMKLFSVPPNAQLHHCLPDDRLGLHKMIRLEEEFGEDDADNAVDECQVSLIRQMT